MQTTQTNLDLGGGFFTSMTKGADSLDLISFSGYILTALTAARLANPFTVSYCRRC